MTNFKGWQIRVFFTDVESVDEIAENETEIELLRKSFYDVIEHLVFDCNFIPREGDVIENNGSDTVEVSSVLFKLSGRKIEFHVTPIEMVTFVINPETTNKIP